MAIEVKVPKDIKEYKEKIIAGMNLKQLLCLTIAAGVNILISLIFHRLVEDPDGNHQLVDDPFIRSPSYRLVGSSEMD